MATSRGRKPRLRFAPLEAARWSDLEKLFGPKGAYGGCWCMYWRETRREFAARAGSGNKRAFRSIVRSRRPTGVLAYAGEAPVGWCAVAPREDYPALERSPVLKRIDDEPVWSITCFYVAREHQGRGVMGALISAAKRYVRERGGRLVEAYPTVPRSARLAPVSSYMGIPSAFEREGFETVARPSKTRLVMRCPL